MDASKNIILTAREVPRVWTYLILAERAPGQNLTIMKLARLNRSETPL